MDRKQIRALHAKLSAFRTQNAYSEKVKIKKPHARPNSISIEDAFFGDSGKGAVIAKLNRLFAKKKKLYSFRYNGGGNAGHESQIDGTIVVTHHLPMGIVQEGATAIIGRGMLLHPEDVVTEINIVKKQFGGRLPGKLQIDENTLLSLDTHRALETVLNFFTTGGRGSTGRGIATGYSSFYERIALRVRDLYDSNWKKIFSDHYNLYANFVRGFGKEYELENIDVVTMESSNLPAGRQRKRKVGSKKIFLQRLEQVRLEFRQYVSAAIYDVLLAVWKDSTIAVTIEGAQGAALDPWHGVYPDVTASRCLSRFINDSTYNVILPEDIYWRLAVMKTTYLSSVGIRTLPTSFDPTQASWIQQSFDERGRSTGRLRDIYEVSLPIGAYIRRAAGYDALVPTHLDASRKDARIPVVIAYKDKSGKETPYLPFQDRLNNLKPEIVSFPGWDGEAVKRSRSPKDLPIEAQNYLLFLSQTLAPVIFGTYGPGLSDYISWTRISSQD